MAVVFPVLSHSEFLDEELQQSSGGLGRVSTRTDYQCTKRSAALICVNGASKFLGAVLQLGGGRAQASEASRVPTSKRAKVHTITRNQCAPNSSKTTSPVDRSPCPCQHLFYHTLEHDWAAPLAAATPPRPPPPALPRTRWPATCSTFPGRSSHRLLPSSTWWSPVAVAAARFDAETRAATARVAALAGGATHSRPNGRARWHGSMSAAGAPPVVCCA